MTILIIIGIIVGLIVIGVRSIIKGTVNGAKSVGRGIYKFSTRNSYKRYM